MNIPPSYPIVGEGGRGFAPWIQALKGQPVTYAIFLAGRLMYVGSALYDGYDTITRHFQKWERRKARYDGGSNFTGVLFEREDVTVAAAITNDPRELETYWRTTYSPTINPLGQDGEPPAQEDESFLDGLLDGLLGED